MKTFDARGFTLVELLVALAAVPTILTALVLLQQQSQLVYLMHAARVEAQQNARWPSP